MPYLFGSRGPRSAGWLAFAIRPERIDVAQVERRLSGRPTVRLCDSYEIRGSDADALARLRKSLNARGLRCSTLLDMGQYQMQLLEAPPVPAAEIRQAVRWKLKDLLDYPVDAASMDVVHVPADTSGSARAQYVHAVSARNDSIAACMKSFHDAGLALQAIDVPEMAQRNIARLFEEPGRGLAMLAIDGRGGMLTFSCGGELYLSRYTDINLRQLGASSRESREQALERLVLELQRSIDHFDRQFSYVTLSRLLMAPLAVEDDIVPYLAEHLYLPVQTLDLAAVMDLPGAPELRDPLQQGARLHILGAALRDDARAH